MDDTRNITDDLKHKSMDNIVSILNTRGVSLEIAIENLERDYNMGTIVRSANAFGVRTVHVIGRKQWNKRGAMMTDKYLHIKYHRSVDDFSNEMHKAKRDIICVDNVAGSVQLSITKLPLRCVLVFGAEGPGLSDDMLTRASKIVAIEQFGSTRSVNVGVAAGITMYTWLQQHRL